LIEFEPVHYPPLARQTRISGTVKIYLSVDVSGAVVDARIISGHPILAETVLASLRVWKFEPLENGQMFSAIDFEFALRNAANDGAGEEVTFNSPGVIRIVSTPPIINTQNYQSAGN